MKTLVLILAVLNLVGCSATQKQVAAPAQRARGSSAGSASAKECTDGSISMSLGSAQYKCADGKWVVDEEAMKYIREWDDHRHKLYWALRTRVLSDKEMAEVELEGSGLLTNAGQSYYAEEVNKEFNDALLLQYKIRDIAHRGRRCAHSEPTRKPDSEKPEKKLP